MWHDGTNSRAIGVRRILQKTVKTVDSVPVRTNTLLKRCVNGNSEFSSRVAGVLGILLSFVICGAAEEREQMLQPQDPVSKQAAHQAEEQHGKRIFFPILLPV